MPSNTQVKLLKDKVKITKTAKEKTDIEHRKIKINSSLVLYQKLLIPEYR